MLMMSMAMMAGVVLQGVPVRALSSVRLMCGGFVNRALNKQLKNRIIRKLTKTLNIKLNLEIVFPACLRLLSGNIIKLLSLTSIALIATGCSNDAVPVNATLSITPETHSTNIVERRNAEGRCEFNTNHYVDIPILMQLNTADGSPIGDTTLNVYADFAENTYTGLPVLKLYDDLNSNGVVDAESELVSGADDSIARVKTGEWTGSRALLLRINLSCSFKGAIFAYTGGISGRASIEVISETVITPTPETGVEQVQTGDDT